MRTWQSDFLLILAAPAFGSFVALLADRLPRGEPVLMSRSRCRSCDVTLGPRDLVPLFSRVWLRGCCRWCKNQIPLSDTIIEIAACGIAVFAVAATASPIATAALGWTLLALAVIDARHMVLPDELTLPMFAAGLLMAVVHGNAFTDGLAGAAIGAAVLMTVATIFRLVDGREGMGLGDVKLFAAGGAWVGWQGLPGVLLIAALSGLLYAVLVGRFSDRAGEPIPFGPFLAAGIWAVWVCGPVPS